MYEVEVKVKLKNPEDVRKRLEELGEKVRTVRQRDLYYQHPCRDFAETDEALRLRCSDDKVALTYKGPKVGREKSRVELEVVVDDFETTDAILRHLGFEPLEHAEVKKLRTVYTLEVNGEKVVAALDEVEGLGTFLELECKADDESEVDEKEKLLVSILEELRVEGKRVRHSYLEMLLDQGE
ncbi:class IV adenylate cyclase [Methanopyrus kandleri]|uniref:Adenylate cyclase, class 2 (Thermophilic) n=2 Tax=Methanopyrus kandleri TaxID=2320 RepID=Q8TX10_METKA|nr:class IV adenylate cyclase [Methanopyrus kandleri]AAM02084.1 Adenylate cyclase, class 2 (thermophilic) [Methanopyrus kandleri AV19]HII69901.1 class IV adenylate cyclase [Methanopyrus kandleri]